MNDCRRHFKEKKQLFINFRKNFEKYIAKVLGIFLKLFFNYFLMITLRGGYY